MVASHWYVSIDDAYHITRTNISGGQCECGKRLVKGMDLREYLAGDEKMCRACYDRFNPAPPIGGPMHLPHYLEAENAALKARVAELEAGLDRLSGQLGRLKEIA